ncbi:phosphoenolpyruvate synthase [Streptomyces sp. NP160]|uniref:PEP/pyruvate-binding domain-containing protein n=1 Tax=Streptomyces sp. NP160 TaxID=2586637 RepID=UPI00111BB9C8|nr:PEP/pyruvate-binding domain-containing protein [Streptomyces sp. NP160]TNM67624.1 phosphoenolpyruvate synthase [Streptomyces sp. NP160]
MDGQIESAYVRFFDDPAEPEHALLGGKCSSLVTMTAAGMPVPPGFAITTAHFDAVLERSGAAAAIASALEHLDPEDVTAVDAASAEIRDLICSFEVPTELREHVVRAYQALQARFDQQVPVAVRSSATAEDLPDASFAGQQDTYLWVRGESSVLEHVRRCWASLYTSRAILYRLRNGIPDEGLSMAVAVQKMVNARASGVALTLDPLTGDRSKITIDSSYGVGEMVVSGQVTPDNHVLDKVVLAVVSETIGDKHAELVPDAGQCQLVEREVEAERRQRRCLTEAELVAVATLAKRAEKHYRCPQDVEWAFDADLPPGQDLLLLQARPETVHSAVPRGVPLAAATAAPAVPAAPPTAASAFSFSALTRASTPGRG